MDQALKQAIDHLINHHDVLLFMKGTKDHPQCGFSKRVVEVLKRLRNDFHTIDVLADPNMREGIKVYSSWPTIPQLYIHGEFVGGCDIVLDLFAKKELHRLMRLDEAKEKPTISLSHNALMAFKGANGDRQDEESFRISINANFEHHLSFDQALSDDFHFSFDDVDIIIDPFSAARANGLSIDYIKDDLEEGFAFNNPNESPSVQELSVEELKDWLGAGKDLHLLDVRTREEWEQARINSAKLLADLSKEFLSSLKPDDHLVFFCHHGGRSRQKAENFRSQGYKNIYNLKGGIDAWAKRIDSSVPVYTR